VSESRQQRFVRERAEIGVVLRIAHAFRQPVFVTQRPARLQSRDARCFDERAALANVHAAPHVIALENRELHRHVVLPDERLAIREERFLPILAADQLDARVTAGAEQIAMRDRDRPERRHACFFAADAG